MRRLPLLLFLFISFPLQAVEEVTVLGLFADKAMVRIDGKQRLLKVGDESPEGVKLIAANSESATLEYNGTQRQMALGAHISSQFTTPEKKSVQIWPDRMGMYSIDGEINGNSITFLVDTGANTIALNANDARRLGIDYKAKGKRVIGETASGRNWVYLLTFDTVSVGSIKLSNVQGIVFDGTHPRKALLGLTFLNRVNMRRDGERLTLEK